MSAFEDIKKHLDIVEVAERYVELERLNANQYKAKTNPLRDERTSSLVFYRDSQRFYDFGTDERGDVLDFVAKVENITLSEARAKLSGDEVSTGARQRPPMQSIKGGYESTPAVSRTQLEKEFGGFDRLSFKTLDHRRELEAIAPVWLYKEAAQADLELFLYLARYDAKAKTLVCGCFQNGEDLSFWIVSYKRRRYRGGKWMTRKDSHPNNTPFIRVYSDDNPVFIVEGHHDLLTAVLLGLDFVMMPTAAFKDESALLEPCEGRDIIFLVEDNKAYNAMRGLAEKLSDVARSIRLKSLGGDEDIKVDLSDFIFRCNSIEEAVNGLRDQG